jgi:hypothetical protein
MASPDDMKAHEGTYESFTTLLRWVVPIVAITTLIIIFLISN